jgi:hypothetical protein
MAGGSSKWAEGFGYILFPANIARSLTSYNFPESTAMDEPGVSLSFSGFVPYAPGVNNAVTFGFGPSGAHTVYTVIRTLTGTNIGQWWRDPFISPGGLRMTGADLKPYNAPNLREIYNVLNNATGSGELHPTQVIDRMKSYTSVNTIGVLDIISEGPIEGFVSGLYIPDFSGKTTGDVGYNSVRFQPFEQTYSNPETRSIYWNDTPITNLQGFYNFQYVDYKFTYGEKTNDHTIFNPYLNLYQDRRNYFGGQVDRNKIPLETSVTKLVNERLYGAYLVTGSQFVYYPKTFYIYNLDVSKIKVNIKVNSLYNSIITGPNAGDIERIRSQFRFLIYRVLSNGEKIILDTSKYPPFVKEAYAKTDIEVAGKITQPNVFSFLINIRPYSENFPFFEILPNQIGWAVDIVKITRESLGGVAFNNTTLDSYTEIYSDRFVYPDTAMVYTKFDARYFASIPDRNYKIRLLKVKIPVNYDPISRKYSGPWNGKFKVAWTDNPAWCFYDLITSNRYGLGKYINSVLTDKWTLYEIAQYCDELVSDGVGGLEPRFVCNLLISTKEQAYKVVNDMASLFRSIVYYSAGQIIVSQDAKKEPVYLFTNSNVINGNFDYQDASKRARKTVAIVRYNDLTRNYKSSIEYIEDRDAILKYGIKETEIVAFGCTSKNQARRLGKWKLVTDNTETETIDFQVGIEGTFVRPGDIINVFDQNRKLKTYAGRTMELKTGYAILDLPYTQQNLYAITGVNKNFQISFLTPTYNLNPGTYLGDFYLTGFSNNLSSSGISGINSSFLRRSQVQTIAINNPIVSISGGSGIYSDKIRINFNTALSTNGYELPQNTIWMMDINPSGYGGVSGGLNVRSNINNSLNTAYPGSNLEPYLNEPKAYRILNITEKENSIYNINALEYNVNKFTDIDNVGVLTNLPVKPPYPLPPTLVPRILYRNTNNILTGSYGVLYTTDQGGINSLMYEIIPRAGTPKENLFYVYVKTGSNYDNLLSAPEINLKDVVAMNEIRTGITPALLNIGQIPPFFTPLYTGDYYFKVFNTNNIGERSTPVTAFLRLTNQAAISTIEATKFNIF